MLQQPYKAGLSPCSNYSFWKSSGFMLFIRGGMYAVKKTTGPVVVTTLTAMLEGERLGIVLCIRFFFTRIAEPN